MNKPELILEYKTQFESLWIDGKNHCDLGNVDEFAEIILELFKLLDKAKKDGILRNEVTDLSNDEIYFKVGETYLNDIQIIIGMACKEFVKSGFSRAQVFCDDINDSILAVIDVLNLFTDKTTSMKIFDKNGKCTYLGKQFSHISNKCRALNQNDAANEFGALVFSISFLTTAEPHELFGVTKAELVAALDEPIRFYKLVKDIPNLDLPGPP